MGDTIPLRGTIYPGTWNFTVRGIYRGADAKTDEQQMFIHWKLLAESIRKHPPQAELQGMMDAAGFARTGFRNLSAGIVAIHTGYKV